MSCLRAILLSILIPTGHVASGLVDYYEAQYHADCIPSVDNCIVSDDVAKSSGTDLLGLEPSSGLLQRRVGSLDFAQIDPFSIEPPDKYPDKFYCGTQRQRRFRRGTIPSDWKAAVAGNPSRTRVNVLVIGDWGSTTCPHEQWDDFMNKCVKYIVNTRKGGFSMNEIWKNEGFLRCGSLHHKCTFEKGMWNSADCDPSMDIFWRHAFAQYQVADQMNKTANAVGGVDFILNVGDNFYLRGVEDERDHNWRVMYENVYHHESLHVPWLSVLGNHDYGGHECDGCLFEGGTGACSGGQIDYDNNKSWVFPHEKQKRWVMPHRYYKKSFKFHDFTIDVFAIDSNFVNTHSMCAGQKLITLEKECNEAQCLKFHADLKIEQMAWLKRELATSKAEWKWVLAHHPCETLGEDLMSLLAKHNVSMVFAGHVHQLRLDKVSTVHCVISGAGGGYQWSGGGHPLYTIRQRGSVDYGFVLLQVERDEVLLRYINDQGQMMWEDYVIQRKAAHISLPGDIEPETDEEKALDNDSNTKDENEEWHEADDGVRCLFSVWSEYGECDHFCGPASQSRTRLVLAGGSSCGSSTYLNDSRECDITACYVWWIVGILSVCAVALGMLFVFKAKSSRTIPPGQQTGPTNVELIKSFDCDA